MPLTSDINGNIGINRFTPTNQFGQVINLNQQTNDYTNYEPDTNNYIHFSKIGEIYAVGKMETTNLFAHPFYYLQNGIIRPNYERIECVKALLFLHTLPFSYDNVSTTTTKLPSFFNNKTGKFANLGGTETYPYGYLLLIGGLIWRKRYMEKNDNADPIKYTTGNDNTPIPSYIFANGYKKPNSYDPLFVKQRINGGYKIVFACQRLSAAGNYYNIKYTDIVSTEGKTLVENKLVNMFLEFTNTTFQTIKRCCELTEIAKTGNVENYQMSDDDATHVTGNSTTRNFEHSYDNYIGWSDITSITNKLKTQEYINKVDNSLDLLNGNVDVTTRLSNTTDDIRVFNVTNFSGNYVMGFVNYRTGILHTYYSEDNPIQEIFKTLYNTDAIVTTIPTPKNVNGIQANTYASYLNGYSKVISQYLETKKKQKPLNDKETKKYERDLKCELYMNLKNIWDRWLCGYYNQKPENENLIAGRDIFKVKNFFENNFVFIDSFYTNIYDMLRLNCKLLLDTYVGSDSQNTKLGLTTVAHLGKIVSVHRCMMFNFPDAVNFTDIDRNGLSMEDYMTNMFKPMASNKIDMPAYSNKFTVIYTHSANKLDTIDRNKFTPDSFDIWSYDHGTGVAPTPFNSPYKGPGKTDDEKLSTENRIAYRVPAFGVAYSRQNNSFWRNIGVGMDNYAVTEQSIRAEAAIAEKGNSDKKTICFYGQDIYSLYQSYSYTVTVEMMGNAQIQPLMYFQLMNVPMFRGSYMIIKVEHMLTPGHMITRFTGVKMSKVQLPFTTSWFTIPDDSDYEEPDYDLDVSDNGEVIISMEGDEIDIEDNKLSKAIKDRLNSEKACDDFVTEVFKDLGVVINGNLRV